MDDQVLNLVPGTVVNGRYEIIRCLGIGSTGVVYLVRNHEHILRHETLSGLPSSEFVTSLDLARLYGSATKTVIGNGAPVGSLLAMKVLYNSISKNPELSARFFNEIESLFSVSHNNVVQISDYFRDDEFIAFTMEYIAGEDLAALIDRSGPLPISVSVRLLAQICAGVAAVHRAGIIHRDLKPSNCLLTKDQQIKLFDFGVSKIVGGRSLTPAGGLVGTLDYLSPEYLLEGMLDHRADIYAIGLLAYFMLTARLPWDGEGRIIDLLMSRVQSEPPPVTEIRKECPVMLSDIISRALARNPDQRYQEASHILRDLRNFSSAYIYLDSSALVKSSFK